jgi:hypothetical protein
MLRYVASGAGERKFRLFYISLCQPFRHLMTNPRSLRSVEVGELYADGLVQEDRRIECFRPAKAVVEEALQRLGAESEPPPGFVAAVLAQLACLPIPDDADTAVQAIDEFALLCRLTGVKSLEECRASVVKIVRDIFGNPFRPVAFAPEWRTADALSLAAGIYADRAFDRLPILADALMDAGCDSEEILAHCRSEGPHVRGCWVVDLVLGKQ